MFTQEKQENQNGQAKKTRYIIYARISDMGGREVSETSIPMQLDQCRKHVENNGGEVFKVIQDEGISGGTLKRPGMQRILESVEEGSDEWDCLIVFKTDRLSRSLKDFLYLFEYFYSKGKSIACVSERIDFSNPVAKASMYMICIFAEMYREQVRMHVRDKSIYMVKEEGAYITGKAPFGYRKLPSKENEKKNHLLIVEPREAEIVKDIFTRYSKGESVDKISRIYPEVKYATITNSILRNRVYLGMINYRKEVFQGKHEPILTQDLFDAVQERLPKTQKALRPNACKYPYLLSGIIFCHCGRSLTPYGSYGRSAKYMYYKCTDKKCASTVSTPLIEKAVKEILISAPMKKTEIRYLIQKANEDRQRIIDCNMPELKNIEMALMKARKEKNNLENAILNDLITTANKDDFNQKFSDLKKELGRLEARNAELAEMVKLYDGEAKFEKMFKSLKTFSDLIRKTETPEVLQRFVKSRVARIEMSPDRKQFSLKLRAFDGSYPDRVWWALIYLEIIFNLTYSRRIIFSFKK